MSPTQLTLRELREKRGFPLVQVVERWNQFAHVRQDLFGIIDVFAVSETEIVAVQTTTNPNFSAHLKKMQDSNALPILIKAGIKVLLHGWSKNKSNRWVV